MAELSLYLHNPETLIKGAIAGGEVQPCGRRGDAGLHSQSLMAWCIASIHITKVSYQGSGRVPVALAIPLSHVIWAGLCLMGHCGLCLMGHCPMHSLGTGSSTASGTVLAQVPASSEVVKATSREDSQCCVDPLSAMEQEYAIRQELGSLHGIPLYKSFIEGWPQVKAFQARPDDLLISTYPKSGTTWLSEVMDMIYHNGDVEKCRRDAIYNRVPFLELKVPKMCGVEQLENTPSPRLVKTHLPVQLLPTSFWEKDCKIIYMARNPKDVVISYYYFHKMAKIHHDPGTKAEFLENFMAGKVPYGSWYDHVRGWWEKKQEKKILYLFYEDMKKDPRQEVQKILQFLGKELSERTVERILHHTSFQEMKKNPAANYETMLPALMDHSISPFLRKGISGDWKNHFTVAQNERFDQHYQELMSGSDLHFQMEV
ncbi:sulfotransferase 1 family member D1 [Taeniopygia guttata]|uniref:sulfotransferase 1 family member D1 n=1 Tax=Taeniopygia guttata TaxID=59729 RepID=UPI0013F2A2D8